MVTCSEDDLLEICGVAYWLLSYGPTSPSGNSMMLTKAAALAAVAVHDGHPRELARKLRKPKSSLPDVEARVLQQGYPDHEQQLGLGDFYGMTDEIEAYWRR